MKQNEGVKELRVYREAFALAMEIFNLTKSFPLEEKFSLIDQVRRSSRSVCANLAEAYSKRVFPKHFRSKLSDSDAELSETLVWIDFAVACNYTNEKTASLLKERYLSVGRMLGKMMSDPSKFKPRTAVPIN